MVLTEKDIIKYCKKGDPKGPKAMVHQYSKVLMGLAYRYTTSQADAKDVIQDTFIQVFKKIDYYDESKGTLLPWLKTITVRMCLMFLRKEKRLLENQKNYFEFKKRQQDYTLLSPDEEKSEFFQLLIQLPDIQRVVFNLKVMEGYSHKEIAIQLDISENNSRTLLNRGRKHLKALVNDSKLNKMSNYGR